MCSYSGNITALFPLKSWCNILQNWQTATVGKQFQTIAVGCAHIMPTYQSSQSFCECGKGASARQRDDWAKFLFWTHASNTAIQKMHSYCHGSRYMLRFCLQIFQISILSRTGNFYLPNVMLSFVKPKQRHVQRKRLQKHEALAGSEILTLCLETAK